MASGDQMCQCGCGAWLGQCRSPGKGRAYSTFSAVPTQLIANLSALEFLKLYNKLPPAGSREAVELIRALDEDTEEQSDETRTGNKCTGSIYHDEFTACPVHDRS